MKEQMPRTPFSTPLSGSAREVELRLKNIFSGPKKRPPGQAAAQLGDVHLQAAGAALQLHPVPLRTEGNLQGDFRVVEESVGHGVQVEDVQAFRVGPGAPAVGQGQRRLKLAVIIQVGRRSCPGRRWTSTPALTGGTSGRTSFCPWPTTRNLT